MKKIIIDVPLVSSYENEQITLEKQKAKLEILLTNGTHAYETSNIVIGSLGGKKLYGNITFWYTYEEEYNRLTLCGNEDKSEKQLQISIITDDNSEDLYHHIINREDKELKENLFTNTVLNSLNLKESLTRVLEVTNNLIIQRLVSEGIIVQVKSPPPKVTIDNVDDFIGLIPPASDAKELPRSQEEKVKMVNGIIESTWGGTVTMNYNENFANVIGSTNDPKIAGNSWLNLWRVNCNGGQDPQYCSSYGYPSGFVCTPNSFLGGHVISGTTASKVAPGSNNVYIYPICPNHNNNDNIHMESKYNHTGVWLNNYMY